MNAQSLHEPASTLCQGKIAVWNAAKGYGFVDDGRRRVFIHINDFVECSKTPAVGDAVTFTLGTDRQGRSCGIDVILQGHGGRSRLVPVGILAALLIAPGGAIWRLAPPAVAPWLAGWVVLASAITFGLYAWDKRRARHGAGRTAEIFLHLWEFLGGWPGGFLAQRLLRHKSAKFSYQLVFWLIIAVHQYAAIDWMLHWRLCAQIRSWVTAL
jgi:uncharacterized membrane protein YsdA (DUF1294 family)/cold shock CspA family protein